MLYVPFHFLKLLRDFCSLFFTDAVPEHCVLLFCQFLQSNLVGEPVDCNSMLEGATTGAQMAIPLFSDNRDDLFSAYFENVSVVHG